MKMVERLLQTKKDLELSFGPELTFANKQVGTNSKKLDHTSSLLNLQKNNPL